jgi:hypothetical protein
MEKVILILLFLGFSAHAQLHHEMLSLDGGTRELSSGLVVRQTIGQRSASGSYSSERFSILQGFQQSIFYGSTPSISTIPVTTITYPNPVEDQVNFKFSRPVWGPIDILIYDLAGRMVYHRQGRALEDVLSVGDIDLEGGQYLILLTGKNYRYQTKILKK